ncbi:MAG: hypothetical protein AAGG69_12520 [Pseudomonadota bacterium]
MSAADTEATKPDLPRYAQFNRADAHGGYSLKSLIVHWIGFVLAAYIAYQMIYGGWYDVPQPLDLGIAAYFLYQCVRRFRRGFPRNANTFLPLALIYRLAQIVMLTSIGVFAIAGATLIWFTGESQPTLLGYPIATFFNDPLPWWRDQAQTIYQWSALAFACGACIQLLSVLYYATQRTMPNLKRLFLPAISGR